MSETERDREVAAGWREASREEPSPALDAAIRAEARRAVSAAPAGPRHRQWRYPAAAAATVAVLAFGIAQMTTRERIEPVIVADQLTPLQKTLPAPAASPPPTAEPAKPPEATTDAKVAAAPAPATQPSSPAPARQTPRKEAGAASQRFAAAPAASREGEAPTAAATLPRTGDARGDSGASNPPQAEPFPSVAQHSGDAEAANEARKNAAAGEQAPSRQTDTPRDTYAQRAPATAVGPIGKVKREQVAASAPLVNSADELKARQAGAESVAAWITRIRALQDSGQLDAAAREVTRFRSVYGDRADALLPPDLRRLTPADAKGQ